jgi:hypothetical protein
VGDASVEVHPGLAALAAAISAAEAVPPTAAFADLVPAAELAGALAAGELEAACGTSDEAEFSFGFFFFLTMGALWLSCEPLCGPAKAGTTKKANHKQSATNFTCILRISPSAGCNSGEIRS